MPDARKGFRRGQPKSQLGRLVRAPAFVVRNIRRAAEAMQPVARFADETLDEGPVGELDVPAFVLTLSI